MFGAVVCPRCRKGFAIDLERRTSSCPHCGRQVQTNRMKTHFTSSSAFLTAKAVGELNSKGRTLKAFDGEVELKVDRPSCSPERVESFLQELDEFGLSDLEALLGGRETAEEMLKRLLLLGSVYESSLGRYRRV
ncbi:MAG: hypothetical protein NT131_01700 [Methanomassiliicoccales archaeon]|nr:hypothetical protein [Methanomassiliicoccales archaeon]